MFKNARKKMAAAISLSLAVAVSLTACTDPAEPGADGFTGIVPIYTPRQGGSAYVIGGGMANLLSDNLEGVQGSVEATTGTQEMVQRLAEKQEAGQPAFIVADSAGQARAYEGEYPFEESYEDIRAVGYVQDTAGHLVVRADSGIESIADLEGKRIGLGVPGSPMNFLTKEVMEAHGVSEGAYEEFPYGYDEVADGLTNGTVDAGIIGGAIPVSVLTELAAQLDVRILPVDPEIMSSLAEEKPYLFGITVDGGAYNGIDEPAETFGFSTSVSTHKDTPDEVVEAMLKVLFEDTEELAKVHSSANGISLENYDRGIAIEFHPAAVEYFESNGAGSE